MVDGGAYRGIAKQFRVSPSAVYRHCPHVLKSLAQAREAQQIAQSTTLLGRVELLIRDCQGISKKAQRAREWHAAVTACREIRGCLELLAEVSGELRKKSEEVNVDVNINLARRALFARMNNGEMERYAISGELPEWWPKAENGNDGRQIN